MATSYHRHSKPPVKLGKMSGKVSISDMKPDAKKAKSGKIQKLKGLKSAIEDFEKKRKKKKKKMKAGD